MSKFEEILNNLLQGGRKVAQATVFESPAQAETHFESAAKGLGRLGSKYAKNFFGGTVTAAYSAFRPYHDTRKKLADYINSNSGLKRYVKTIRSIKFGMNPEKIATNLAKAVKDSDEVAEILGLGASTYKNKPVKEIAKTIMDASHFAKFFETGNTRKLKEALLDEVLKRKDIGLEDKEKEHAKFMLLHGHVGTTFDGLRYYLSTEGAWGLMAGAAAQAALHNKNFVIRTLGSTLASLAGAALSPYGRYKIKNYWENTRWSEQPPSLPTPSGEFVEGKVPEDVNATLGSALKAGWQYAKENIGAHLATGVALSAIGSLIKHAKNAVAAK